MQLQVQSLSLGTLDYWVCVNLVNVCVVVFEFLDMGKHVG